MYKYSGIGDDIIPMETPFLLLTSFFRISSCLVIKEKLLKLTAFLDFHAFVYPCLIQTKIKVVLIVLMKLLTTECYCMSAGFKTNLN